MAKKPIQLALDGVLAASPKKGGWHHDGVFTPKPCAKCGTIFTPVSGYAKFCSKVCGKKKGRLGTEAQYARISGNWRAYFQRLLNGHAGRKKHLKVEDLENLLQKQGGRCALTGEVLTCTLERGSFCKTNASIDRLTAGGDYSLDNIQLVCSSVNILRVDMPVEEFKQWCKKVVEYANAEKT